LADRAALGPLPARPYVVCERHLRTVGKDCLVSFEASVYSVPWRAVTRRMKVELRVDVETAAIWTPGAEPRLLATHARAHCRGTWIVDPVHWDGLPDGVMPECRDNPVAPVRDEAALMASPSPSVGRCGLRRGRGPVW